MSKEAKRMGENEQSFGECLRHLIKVSGMTQHTFYTELGIRKPYFYDILSGRTNPPPYPLQLRAMEILQVIPKNPLYQKRRKARQQRDFLHRNLV